MPNQYRLGRSSYIKQIYRDRIAFLKHVYYYRNEKRSKTLSRKKSKRRKSWKTSSLTLSKPRSFSWRTLLSDKHLRVLLWRLLWARNLLQIFWVWTRKALSSWNRRWLRRPQPRRTSILHCIRWEWRLEGALPGLLWKEICPWLGFNDAVRQADKEKRWN
jgi:hypothetical protein